MPMLLVSVSSNGVEIVTMLRLSSILVQVDACVCNDRHVPFAHYLPGIASRTIWSMIIVVIHDRQIIRGLDIS